MDYLRRESTSREIESRLSPGTDRSKQRRVSFSTPPITDPKTGPGSNPSPQGSRKSSLSNILAMRKKSIKDPMQLSTLSLPETSSEVLTFQRRKNSSGNSLQIPSSRRSSSGFSSSSLMSTSEDFVDSEIFMDSSEYKYYRPIEPEEMDRLMFLAGTDGRQATQRRTAPEVFASLTPRRRSRGSAEGEQSLADVTNVLRSSVSSDPGRTRRSSSDFRRASLLVGRSQSLVDKIGKTENNGTAPRNTRKFLFSLAKMAKTRDSFNKKSSEPGEARSKFSIVQSIGLKALLKRDLLSGSSRMATLGALVAARRRHSLNHYLMKFDATLVWKKLRLWVRIRSMLGRLHKEVIDRVVHDPSSIFYMQFNKEDNGIGIDKNHYMFFDPSDFKANRQMRTSQEVKRVLTLPPGERTPEDIHAAMIGLRGINTLAEYPVRMQRYLAEFGTFECYNAKRAIVRQGRPPEAFYYILYGRVLVAVKDETTGRVDIKCYLHRGHSFGELAIIKNVERQSSVLTKNYTELLCLSSDVFQKYFMVGGVKNLHDPDFNNFIRSLNFLKGWPLELITEQQEAHSITFGYFKRGSILVKDSNCSDWLIIVKSGSLQVLKKLIKSRPTVSKKTGNLLPTKDPRCLLGFLDNASEYMKELELHNLLPPPFDPHGHDHCDVTPDDLNSSDVRDADDDEVHRVTMANRPHTTAGKGVTYMQRSRVTWSRGSSLSTKSSFVEFKADNLVLKRNKSEIRLNSNSSSNQRARSYSRDFDPHDDGFELDDKRTFLDDLDSAYNTKAQVRTEADLNPQFVYVQTLTKGDVFGLAQCLFCDQPSMCVVSNGADCLLLNKKTFLENCSSEVIRRLRVEVSPYPSEEKLQEDLVTRINWDIYKDALKKQLLTAKTAKRSVSMINLT